MPQALHSLAMLFLSWATLLISFIYMCIQCLGHFSHLLWLLLNVPVVADENSYIQEKTFQQDRHKKKTQQ
jgi:hypothetical protein